LILTKPIHTFYIHSSHDSSQVYIQTPDPPLVTKPLTLTARERKSKACAQQLALEPADVLGFGQSARIQDAPDPLLRAPYKKVYSKAAFTAALVSNLKQRSLDTPALMLFARVVTHACAAVCFHAVVVTRRSLRPR
jgi:hypothetical protein